MSDWIKHILNNLTPGARRAKLGDMVSSMQADIADLKTRVAALEAAP